MIRKNMLDQYGVQEKKTQDKTQMNKDTFLNLLVTQMQHQDPLEPTKNEDFLAQMAQFSALEQMNNLNKSFLVQQGSGLIGNIVHGKIVNPQTSQTEYIQGRVDRTLMKDGQVLLIVVNNKGVEQELPVEKVFEVQKSVDSAVTHSFLGDISTQMKALNEKIDTLSKKIEVNANLSEAEKKVEKKAEKEKVTTEGVDGE